MAKTLAPRRWYDIGTHYVSNMWRQKSSLGREETQRWEIAASKHSQPVGENTAQLVAKASPHPPKKGGGLMAFREGSKNFHKFCNLAFRFYRCVQPRFEL